MVSACPPDHRMSLTFCRSSRSCSKCCSRSSTARVTAGVWYATCSSAAEFERLMPGNFYRTLRSMLTDGLIEDAPSRVRYRRRGRTAPVLPLTKSAKRRQSPKRGVSRRWSSNREQSASCRRDREGDVRWRDLVYGLLLLAFPRRCAPRVRQRDAPVVRGPMARGRQHAGPTQLDAARHRRCARAWARRAPPANCHAGERPRPGQASMEVVDESLSARLPICPAGARAATRRDARRDAHAGARHRCELRHLLRRQRRSAAAATLRESRPPRHGLGEARCRRRVRQRRRAGRLPRLDDDEQQLREHGRNDRHHVDLTGFGEPVRLFAGVVSPPFLDVLTGAPAARAHLSPGGGHAGKHRVVNSRSLVVGQPLRWRSGRSSGGRSSSTACRAKWSACLPPTFEFPDDSLDIWVPLPLDGELRSIARAISSTCMRG